MQTSVTCLSAVLFLRIIYGAFRSWRTRKQMNLKEDGPIYAIKSLCSRIFISSHISDRGIENEICQ